MARLLAVLLPALLLAPSAAAAWTLTLDAPPAAPLGLPFLVALCVAGAGAGEAVQVRLVAEAPAKLRTRQEDVPVVPGRYGPPFLADAQGRACRDVEVEASGAAGPAALEARARPEGGEVRARAGAALRLARTVAVALAGEGTGALLGPEGTLLRVPSREGALLVPLLEGASGFRVEGGLDQPLPPAPGLRLREARAEGAVVLENAGAAPAWLAGHRLVMDGRATPLPPLALAPGELLHVGRAPSPDGLRHAAAALRVSEGPLSLEVGAAGLDRLDVPRLPEGHAVDDEGRVFRPGRTRLPAEPMEVRGALLAYATPDAGAAPLLDLLASARREVLVEGYTLTSPDVAAALLEARSRGVEVRVLLEGAPVGGVPHAQKELLGALAAGGVEASLMRAAKGFPARYASVHAKVVVVDREAVLVATENLHESSYPAFASPRGTRGFGLVVWNATLAARFADAFYADAAPWPDVARVSAAPSPAPLPRAGADRGPALRLEGAWTVTPMLQPDAGVEGMAALLAGAQGRVDVAMLFADAGFGDGPSPFLEALVDAARRGARVRLLLDGHLDAGRNGEVARSLQARADAEGLPLEARLSAPGRTLHAKLVLVDGARAYVGSMNWGEASALRNREAGLVVESAEAAGWLEAWFEKEWEPVPEGANGAPGPGPVGMGLAVLGACALRRVLPRRSPRSRPRRA